MIRFIVVLTAAGIVLSLLSASAALVEISDGGVADEQEIPATVEPDPTEAAQGRELTMDSSVTAVDVDATSEPHPFDGEELISFDGSAETEEAFKALEPIGRFGTPEEIA